MAAMKDLSHAQSRFLRAFGRSPHGPPPDAWPSPLVFQRWLAHDAFRHAYRALRAALKAQLELRSLCAALAAHDDLDPRNTPVPIPTPAPTPTPTPATAPTPAPSDPNLNPEPQTLNPHPKPQPPNPRPLDPAKLALDREKLRHRANLAFLRLAHARLTPPPRPAAKRPGPQPEPAPQPDPYANETLEEAAVRLMHPNCRPEVAIAFIKGEPHPYYHKPEYDMTTDPPTLIRPPSPAAVARAADARAEAAAIHAANGIDPPPEPARNPDNTSIY